MFVGTDSATLRLVETPQSGGGLVSHQLAGEDNLVGGGGDLVGGGGDLVGGSGDLVEGGGDLVGSGGDLVGGSGDLVGGSGDLVEGGDDLVGGGGDLVGGSGDLVGGDDLVGGGGDLVGGGGDLVRGGDQVEICGDDCIQGDGEQGSVLGDCDDGMDVGDGMVGGGDGVVGNGDGMVSGGDGDGVVSGGGGGVVGNGDGVVSGGNGDGVLGGGDGDGEVSGGGGDGDGVVSGGDGDGVVSGGGGEGDRSLSPVPAPNETESLSDLDLSVSECSSTCSNETLADPLDCLEECDAEEATDVHPPPSSQPPLAAGADLPPPSCPAPPTPPVHAAADTMSSDTDSELSLSEVESLSPLPPSPHLRLPTLSPLPLSPQGQVLSPLPRSPAVPCHRIPEPLEFVAVAPHHSALCVPIPTPLPPPTDVPATHPHPTTLHRSQSSPFTTPLAQQPQPSPVPPPPPSLLPAGRAVSGTDSPLPVEPGACLFPIPAVDDIQPVCVDGGQSGGKDEIARDVESGTKPVEEEGETVSHPRQPSADKEEVVVEMEGCSADRQLENELEEGELVDSEGEGEREVKVGGNSEEIQMGEMSPDVVAAARPASLSPQSSTHNQPSPCQGPPQLLPPKPNTVRHKAIDILTSALVVSTSSPPKRRQQICKPSPIRASCPKPPSATPTDDLPGYSLRYRTVSFREHKPPKRRHRGSQEESPQAKALKTVCGRTVCGELCIAVEDQDRTEPGAESRIATTISTVDSQESDSQGGECGGHEGGNGDNGGAGEGGKEQDVRSKPLPCGGQGSAHVLPAASPACAPTSKHVRLTDRATGQEEDLTPLSSPGDSEKSHVPTTSTPVLPPPPKLHCSLSARPPAAFLPVPSTTPHSSGPPAATPVAPTMLQRSLEPAFLCPLPLPAWLVSTMTRLQAMTTLTQPAKAIRGKKRNRKTV